ncbi:BTAD domain-containing putative transcriptional regulator [Actinophytocola sp.]|uniref:AfsR/SARP family transcriptional regulator n=1 Tax=Actinophytocola sp. TaxID=1872138 RepID=UPI00389A28EC
MRLLLLGPLALLDAQGNPVAVSGTKRRATLAALALRGTVSTDRLVAELWGNTPPANASNALQAHITRLRRALTAAGGEPDRIVTGPSHYTLVLRPGERDTVDFDSAVDSARRAADPIPPLRSALALWRGPALSGCVLGDICAAEADALDERRLTALELLYDASLRAGRHREVVGELARSTAAHPLRERFYEQLIVALRRCGRRTDAVEVYDRARRRLRAELDVEPGPGLRRVIASMP